MRHTLPSKDVCGVIPKNVCPTVRTGSTLQRMPNRTLFMMHLLAMPVIILASMQQHSDIAGFLSLLSTLVGPGATLVDIGCNKGNVFFEMITLWATKNASFIAADMNPANAHLVRDLLQPGIDCNGKDAMHSKEFRHIGGYSKHCKRATAARALLGDRPWTTEALAFSSRLGETKLCATPLGWEHAHLGGAAKMYGPQQPEDEIARHGYGQRNCQRVPVTTLDAWLGPKLRRKATAVVKVDAEGFDGPILLGSRQLLASHKIDALIFECCHLWDRAVTANELLPNAFGAVTPLDGPPVVWTNRSSSHIYSLAAAMEPLGYSLFALGPQPEPGSRRVPNGIGCMHCTEYQRISPSLHRNSEELVKYTRARWSNFALVRAGLALPSSPWQKPEKSRERSRP